MKFSRTVSIAISIGLFCCAPPDGNEFEAQREVTEPVAHEIVKNWIRYPISSEIQACQPSSTDIPPGEVQLFCEVGGGGRIGRCVVQHSTDDRLQDWSICLSKYFLASSEYEGKLVIVPLKWVPEP